MLGRTGQFGIGVLSYFMIANKVIIRTRRSQEAGDSEETGWHFETEGIGSFGELRQGSTLQRGTEVRLRLSPNIMSDSPSDWYSNLRGYLMRIMARLPCKFQLNTTIISGCQNLSLSAGWSRNPNEFIEESLSERARERVDKRVDKKLPLELLSHTRRQEREAEERDWEQLSSETSQCIRWEMREGDLPAGLGRFRIHVPYFTLPGGAALVFLRVRKESGKILLMRIGDCYGYFPDTNLLMSWKGMRVWFSREGSLTATIGFLEVDWTSSAAGEISVNRGEIKLSANAIQALDWLDQQISEIGRVFLQNNESSVYALLNSQIAESELRLDKPLNWLSFLREGEDLKACWKPLPFPCINGMSLYLRAKTLAWKNRQVFIIPEVSVYIGRFSDKDFNWTPPSSSPDRIMACRYGYGFEPVAFWAHKPKAKKTAHLIGLTCRFPPKWSNVVCVSVSDYSREYSRTNIWNPSHAVLRAIDASGWEWTLNFFRHTLDPLPFKGDVLKHKSRAASWVIRCLEQRAKDLWDGLNDRDPLFLKELWMLIFKSSSRSDMKSMNPVCQFTQARGLDSSLNVLNPERWATWDERDKRFRKYREQYLPDPGPEWHLKQIVDDSPSDVEE